MAGSEGASHRAARQAGGGFEKDKKRTTNLKNENDTRNTKARNTW
jgi:hypothetical protein